MALPRGGLIDATLAVGLAAAGLSAVVAGWPDGAVGPGDRTVR